MLVYWIKVDGSKRQIVYMGEVDSVFDVPKLFRRKGVRFMMDKTGVVLVKVAGHGIFIEMYENGLAKGVTKRMSGKWLKGMCALLEDAERRLQEKTEKR